MKSIPVTLRNGPRGQIREGVVRIEGATLLTLVNRKGETEKMVYARKGTPDERAASMIDLALAIIGSQTTEALLSHSGLLRNARAIAAMTGGEE